MSYCRSSGCNYRPCSQSQKMSIGIVVDSVAKPYYEFGKEAEFSKTHVEKEAYNLEGMVAGQNVKQGVKASDAVTRSLDGVQEDSAMITAVTVGANMLMKDFDHIEKQASKPGISSSDDKQITHQSHFFANQTELQPPGVGQKIEAGGVITGKESKSSDTHEKFDEISRAHKQEACVVVKRTLQEQPNEMEYGRKEALRMKLREILGTVPSANKKYGDSKIDIEVGTNEMTWKQTPDCDACFKSRQNSDTIETDSENADTTIRRPVTRSLSRKKAPNYLKPRDLNTITKSLSCHKKEHQDADSCKPFITGSKQPPGLEQLPSGDRTIYASKHACQNKSSEPEAAPKNQDINQSPVVGEKGQPQEADSPAVAENSDHLESCRGQYPTHHHDDLSTPYFKMTKTLPNSPMSFLPQINEMKLHLHRSAKADSGPLPKATYILKSSPAMEKDTSGFSDDVATPEDAYDGTPEPSSEENDAVNGTSTPDRRKFDSTEEVSSAKTVYPEDIPTSPEAELVKKPVLFRSKRHCTRGDDWTNCSPILNSPIANGTTDDVFMEPSEGSPEDGFARVVSLLGLALKRITNKTMLMTNKKCSDILLSTAEEIQSQLQSVESQIQTDLGKLASFSKSKRKHLEMRLQEQQEHLKAIHEKFKEEIHQYLQDCKGDLEGLETQHVELEAAMERQNASHKKLLLQAEVAVETHLNDAQRRITSVRKLGKQKILQLKVAVVECFKD